MALKISGAPLPRARNVTPSAQEQSRQIFFTERKNKPFSKTDQNSQVGQTSCLLVNQQSVCCVLFVHEHPDKVRTEDVGKGYSHIMGEVQKGRDG